MGFFIYITCLTFWIYLLYKYFLYRIEIRWERTFWMKRIVGIEIWFYDKNLSKGYNYGFSWKTLTDEEEDLEYKEYTKK